MERERTMENEQKPTIEYTKFRTGDNRLRILAEPEKGYQAFVKGDDGKGHPVRRRSEGELIRAVGTTDTQIKELWVMPVYNYATEKVEVLNVTQRGIQSDLQNLSEDEDWGSFLNYDVVVTRTGEGMETRYGTMPKPVKPVSEEIKAKWEQAGIELGRTFEPREQSQTQV